jgi:hypothetical protein
MGSRLIHRLNLFSDIGMRWARLIRSRRMLERIT